MSADRFAIRCPSCLAEGRARPEHLHKRIRCKHCSHTFRAEPAAVRPASPRPARDPIRLRVEALEREVRAIREALPRPIPKYPEPESSPAPAPGPDDGDLRGQLARAVEAARQAEAREAAQKAADAERIADLRRQIVALRAQVGPLEAAAPLASSAFEPSAEAQVPDNSRPWPSIHRPIE